MLVDIRGQRGVCSVGEGAHGVGAGLGVARLGQARVARVQRAVNSRAPLRVVDQLEVTAYLKLQVSTLSMHFNLIFV